MTIKQTLDELKAALVADGVVMVDKDAALMAAYQMGAKDAYQTVKVSVPYIVGEPGHEKVTAKPAPKEKTTKKK